MDQPSPIDTSVLDQQSTHRSEMIAVGQPCLDFDVVHVEGRWRTAMSHMFLHTRLVHQIDIAGFSGFLSVRFRSLDHGLITALVERWREETHTFHFPVGEATITLQDVEVLYGLRVDGEAVTGRRLPHGLTLPAWFQQYLGYTPDEGHFDRGSIQVTSLTTRLRERAAHIVHTDPDDVVAQDARLLCACMIASLFIDTGGAHIKVMYLLLLQDLTFSGTLSWGSAALVTLYRNMCLASRKARGKIAGPLGLLQVHVQY